MAKKNKGKLSKRALKERYPAKVGKDEEVVRFAGKLFFIFSFFLLVAASVDVFHFTH